MTEPRSGSSSLKVEDLAKTFTLSYAQMAKAITAYERVTEAPFPRLGRCKQIPPEFLEICTIAVKEVKSTPNATYRSAFERAIVRHDQRRQRTTPVTLAAALQGVALAQNALTNHVEQTPFDHRDPGRVISLITRLRERTRLLQRLLPELDANGPETWTPQQAHDLVMVLKLLADATAGLLATDQLLYAHLQYWEIQDDRAYKVLRKFLSRWEKLNGFKPAPEHTEGLKPPQEAPMTQPNDKTPDQDETSEPLVFPFPALPKTAPSWDEFEKWPVLDDLSKGLSDLGGLGDMPPEDDDELDLELDLDLDLSLDELNLDEEVIGDSSGGSVVTAPHRDLDGFDFVEPTKVRTEGNLSVVPTEQQQKITTRPSTRIRPSSLSYTPEKRIDTMPEERQDLPPQ